MKVFIKKHKPLLVFLLVYILLRLLFLNVNYTEWGDAFRMIRGAEYLSHLSWPWDEKRWPLYSLFLLPGIWLNAPVLWGRLLSIVISSFILVLVYFFYIQYIGKKEKYALFASILTMTSSVFAYWSFRIMADPLFSLLILAYIYLFVYTYSRKQQGSADVYIKGVLSILLLMITMTRFEGVFVLTGTFVYFLLVFKDSKMAVIKDSLTFYIPQILVYIPWTLYSKVLYKGIVSNDYLREVQTFVFDFARFEYFLAYTLFILVIPVFSYFVLDGFIRFMRKNWRRLKVLPFVPLLAFIIQELLIGFVWTPSLPRIYLPIIPFLIMFGVYGFEKFHVLKAKGNPSYIISAIVLTVLFAVLQYKYKLYFLGASKVLYAIILLASLDMIFSIYYPRYFRKVFIGYMVFLGVLVSVIVINNQTNIYKTVKKGINYLDDKSGIVAYSDETGNTSWYLRGNSYYLPKNQETSLDDQYELLKQKNVAYILWTNEFNRGSRFIDPAGDTRYELLVEYSQPIQDPLDSLAAKVGFLNSEDYIVYKTKIYKLK